MSKLLISDTSIFLIIGAILLIILGYYIIKYLIKHKKPKGEKIKIEKTKKVKKIKDKKTENDDKPLSLMLNEKYMYQKELKFQSTLAKILPDSLVAFPRVGVDNIISPKGSMNDYNNLMSKYVDFCVFEKASMKPVLVIDLYDDTFSDQDLQSTDKSIVEALNFVDLPILPVLYKPVMDEKELQTQIKEKLTQKKD